MRFTVALLILVILIGCSPSKTVNSQKTVYSPPGRPIQIELDETSINKIKTFRDSDFSPFIEKSEETFNHPKSLLAWQPGFIVGAEKSTPTRRIEVVLFESYEYALKAVEIRNDKVSSPKLNIMNDSDSSSIYIWNPSTTEYHMGKGTRNGIKNWWYSDSPSLGSLNTGSLCIVKDNMIISVYDNTIKYSEIEDELWSTANYCIELLKTHK